MVPEERVLWAYMHTCTHTHNFKLKASESPQMKDEAMSGDLLIFLKSNCLQRTQMSSTSIVGATESGKTGSYCWKQVSYGQENSKRH